MRPVILTLAVAFLFALPPTHASQTRPRQNTVPRIAIPTLPLVAPRADVKSILDELALPPLPLTSAPPPVPLYPFVADTLKPYARDATVEEILHNVEKYRLRAGVLRALQAMRDTSLTADPRAPKPLTRIDSPVTDKTKKTISAAQEHLALNIARLELELDALTQLDKLRGKETKRWQAHYDFTLAQLHMRLAMLSEYNKLLGDVRTERLPDLIDGATGWRFVPAEKMQSNKQVQQLFSAATTAFETVAADHKGTPWEVLARRALLTPPGLKWEAAGK